MKANKKTMFAAALAVAVIALAGVGYAALTSHDYKAVTVNPGNTDSSAYVIASQGNGYTAMVTASGIVYLNTYTDANHDEDSAIYVIDGGNATVGELKGKAIGTTNTIALELSENLTSASVIQMAVSTTVDPVDGWTYYLGVKNADASDDASEVPIFIEVGDSSPVPVTAKGTEYIVQLYIAGPDFNSIDSIDYEGYDGFGSSVDYDGTVILMPTFDLAFEFTVTAS